MKESARLFKALADPTRLRLLLLLRERELCVCDLVAILNLPQSTVSRHLSSLLQAGLVEDRRQGVWMYYRLAVSGEPLPRELLRLLGSQLAASPQAGRDREARADFLARKEAGACS